MTYSAPPSGHDIPAEKPLERAQRVHPDLESALIEGLSGAPSLSPENPGSADPPDDSEPVGGIDADFEAILLESLSDISPVSSEEPAGTDPVEDTGPPVEAEDADAGEAESAAVLDAEFESALLQGLSTEPDPPASPDSPAPSSDAVSEPDDSVAATAFDFENSLLEGLSGDPSASSDANLSEDPPSSAAPEDPDDDLTSALPDNFSNRPPESSGNTEPADPPAVSGPAEALPETGPEADADTGHAPGDRGPDEPAAALAFALDPETEHALREGLLHFEGPTPECDDPQVWPGGILAAVAALSGGHSSQLVIVDIDGIPYPAGAIHELAEVCEMGTVVIAVGSDDSARINREILLAGVSDYLVKPVTAAEVREAAALATASDRNFPIGGHVAGFAGTGGSGTTTVAAATALHAAAQGRYVSVLDLNRTVPAMALLLDVEPSAGLDQLFDVAGRMPPDAQMLDGVRAERSDRISLYAYRLGVSPPPAPPMPALDWLLGQLRHRSQLVLVDGLDDPEVHFSLLAEVDARVLVAEPTAAGAVRAARILDLLGGGAPPILVQNHTRAFKPQAGARLLLDAGVETSPDVVIPFEPTLPEIADRGWPRGRMPRRLRKPIASLADRIPMQAMAGRPALPETSGGI